MNIHFQMWEGLPFVTVTLVVNGLELTLAKVLIDTGSDGTFFRSEDFERIGAKLQPTDSLQYVIGIGGGETVVETQIDSLQVGDLTAYSFTIQLGALDYGFEIDGILGSDFLLATGARIDYQNLTIGQ